ncbi:MAG: hypothetical protein DWQ04_28030 [Chloroflexi bacterium]|nr:MAG: hypothetical protein DWQ04_28030 [Chloroflexota bacterium]
MNKNQNYWWSVELEGMPQFDMAMKRIYAWFENEIIDRPPIRFVAHNEFLESETEEISTLTKAEKKAWWFDVENQVELFVKSILGKTFHGETFPVFFPNLGPDVYAAFYGANLEFGEVTSWSVPLVRNWDSADKLKLDKNNIYFKKLEELTHHALERCPGKFMVGYTDLHPGLDCVAAWRDPQQLCFDLMDHPERVERLAEVAIADFESVYNHFDEMLKANGQLSVSWMGIPSFGRMHIPSCDFSTMISPKFFKRFGLPILEREVKTMTHNIFHVDGKGVARHLDAILSVPEVHAVQWVQGVGNDLPIMQWVPFIKKLQAKNVPLIVDLHKSEVDAFICEMEPQGLFLWVATDNEDEEKNLLKRIAKWA